MALATDISIEPFDHGNHKHPHKFAELNREWLDGYGLLEAADEAMLADPKGSVLDKDGLILFASFNGEIIGTGALLKCEEGCYEIAKMGVSSGVRGRGVGRKLAETLISTARAKGARKLYIESNRKLDRALALYRSLGFKELPQVENSPYTTCDIAFEMVLPLDPTRYGDWEINGKCVDF
jgi:ribosomal protein S18 acetylase RimI-like enzyme